MIFSRYSGLSLQEIDFAFRHNRYSGEPIPHYQQFNAEYVSLVLNRYKAYIKQIRVENNISLSNIQIDRTFTEEEKSKIHEEFLLLVYNEIKLNNFYDSAFFLWDEIKNKHMKPPQLLQRLFLVQKSKYLKTKPKNFNLDKEGGKKTVQNICRSIVVSNYLKKHLSDFETFKKSLI